MNKYRNVKTVVDNITFASAKEARRYSDLKLLERAKKISALTLQPRYPLMVNGHRVCVYVPDFSYIEDGKLIADDTKGMRTQVYILKKKLFVALFPDIIHRES